MGGINKIKKRNNTMNENAYHVYPSPAGRKIKRVRN